MAFFFALICSVVIRIVVVVIIIVVFEFSGKMPFSFVVLARGAVGIVQDEFAAPEDGFSRRLPIMILAISATLFLDMPFDGYGLGLTHPIEYFFPFIS